MAGKLRIPLVGLVKHLRNKLLLGIIIIVPVGATILILVWIFNGIDNILQPIIRSTWGQTYPGIGFGIIVLLVYLAGLLASSILGRRILAFGERLLNRIPLFRQLYRGIKQIFNSFTEPHETGFMQVVFVEYPRKGLHAIGFVTNKLGTGSGKQLYTVFIPTSPNPTSGFMQIVGEDDIIRTDISVEEALRIVVSAGRVPLETEALLNTEGSA